jgi:hypothetical protein
LARRVSREISCKRREAYFVILNREEDKAVTRLLEQRFLTLWEVDITDVFAGTEGITSSASGSSVSEAFRVVNECLHRLDG